MKTGSCRNPGKYSACVFDFDGTLVLSNGIKRDTFFEVTAYLQDSKKILRQIFEKYPHFNRTEVFSEFVAHLPEEMNAEGLSEELEVQYSAECEGKIVEAPEVPYATSTLKKLHENKNIKTYISSATPEKYLERIIKKRHMTPLFDGIFGGPSTKITHINEILGENGLSNNKLLYIGDSEDDRIAADGCGCDFIGIGKDCSRFMQQPQHVIEDYQNFFTYLGLK